MNSKRRQSFYLRLGIAGLFLAIACGCNPVICKRAVGEKPAKIAAREWEGVWLGPDGAVNIKVVDSDQAVLSIAWLEDDEQGKPAMKMAAVELRESGSWLFASTSEENKGHSRGYLWARIEKEDRKIIVWEPDGKLFAQLVNNGVIPGRLDKDDVILDEIEPQYLKMITSGELGVPFSWDKPIVFVRAGN